MTPLYWIIVAGAAWLGGVLFTFEMSSWHASQERLHDWSHTVPDACIATCFTVRDSPFAKPASWNWLLYIKVRVST